MPSCSFAITRVLSQDDHTWTIGWISGGRGSLDNFIGQNVNGWNSAAWKCTNKLIVNEVFKTPTTTKDQTSCPCVLRTLNVLLARWRCNAIIRLFHQRILHDPHRNRTDLMTTATSSIHSEEWSRDRTARKTKELRIPLMRRILPRSEQTS